MSSRSPPGSPATPAGTWPSPPAPPAPTCWTSTSTARTAPGSPPTPGSAAPGCSTGATAYVRTPSGGLHAYFTGTGQRNGHLPAHHLDFRSAGGYILAPPSHVGGHPYQLLTTTGAHGTLDWQAAPSSCNPTGSSNAPSPARPQTRPLITWPAGSPAQPEGNRNAGLFWAANRALETDPAADLSPLAAAARHAGLGDHRDHPDPGLRPPNRPAPPQPARSPSRGSELT